MINETMEKMWNIIKENDFQVDGTIKSEISCTSCKHIMVKSCNVPCGCRYCYDCLISYLNGEEKPCLGESIECQSVLINIDKNVCNDQAVNIKISRTAVKCPFESCELNTELGRMASHMGICDKKPMSCPYYAIGCDENKIGFDKMKLHFKQENLCHAKLIMNFVDNWGNEMTLLKTNILSLQEEYKCLMKQMELKQERVLTMEENIAKLLQENASLKELETEHSCQNNQMNEIILAMQMKLQEQDEKIEKNQKKLEEIEINQEQMRTTIERLTQENTSLHGQLEIINSEKENKEKLDEEVQKIEKQKFEEHQQMKTSIEDLFKESKSLRERIETANQESILAIQTKTEEQKKEIKANTEEQKKEIKANTDNIKHLTQKCNQIEKNQEQMEAKIKGVSLGNDTITTKLRLSENAIKTLETKLAQIKSNQDYGEFVWCIKNWDQKKRQAQNGTETEIYSDPFYSHKNGYKMRLVLDPNGDEEDKKGTHLSLFICIIQGEYDNILHWPFRHRVKLDLMNQKTGLIHLSKIVKAGDDPTNDSWKKPTGEANIEYGFPQFIEQSMLSSSTDICLGNQILIKATLQIMP